MILPTSFDKIFHNPSVRRNASFREPQLSTLHNPEPGKKGRVRSQSLENTTEELKMTVDQVSPKGKADGEIND